MTWPTLAAQVYVPRGIERRRDLSEAMLPPLPRRGERSVAFLPAPQGISPLPLLLSRAILVRPIERVPERVVGLRAPAGGGGFSFIQYAGLRAWSGSLVELCLVDRVNAPALPIQKNGVDLGIYLVETSDPDASPVRISTSAGTKAVRLKT